MAKNKLTTCKVCGAEVAKSAKVCPSCGAKVKNKNFLLIGIIAIVVIAIIAAASNNDEPKKVNGDDTVTVTEKNAENEKNTFLVGETAELKDVLVSMVNVTESNGSTFNTPTDGNVFVLCEFEIANNSSKELTVSSMLSFEAYCDDYYCAYSLGALLEKGNKNQLDGTVAPGKKLSGVIGYEVPENWGSLEIHFTPDFWNGKDIVFVANK